MRKRNNRLDNLAVKPSNFKGATTRAANKHVRKTGPSLRKLRRETSFHTK